jgi:hypothetical protein
MLFIDDESIKVLQVSSVVVSSTMGLLIEGCQIILSSIVGPCISFVVNIDWIVIGEEK